MSSAAPVWLNGRLLKGDRPCLSLSDRGLNLSDGLFETIRAEGDILLWLDDHLTRLHAGTHLLGIDLPLSDAQIADGLRRLLKAAGYKQSALRLTVTRGPAAKRGLWPPGDPVCPTLAATIAPFVPARQKVRVIVATSTRRNEHSPLSGIKSLNYGDNLLARREADARGADDALMQNGAGRLVCGTVGNLFARIGGNWCTPPLDDGALPGLARRRLIGLLGAREVSIPAAEVASIESAFLANCLGLSSIHALDDRVLGDCDLPEKALFDSLG